MTYRELAEFCNSLTESQKDMDVSIAIISCGLLDEVVDGELVNPLTIGEDHTERDYFYLDEVCGREGDSSILDFDHPYFTAFMD